MNNARMSQKRQTATATLEGNKPTNLLLSKSSCFIFLTVNISKPKFLISDQEQLMTVSIGFAEISTAVQIEQIILDINEHNVADSTPWIVGFSGGKGSTTVLQLPKDKKRNTILERLIREIRSKGASVFLMSQSPDDYDHENFDFTELLEFIFLLQSNAGATKFLHNAFGPTALQSKSISAEVTNLPTAMAIGKSHDTETQAKVSRL